MRKTPFEIAFLINCRPNLIFISQPITVADQVYLHKLMAQNTNIVYYMEANPTYPDFNLRTTCSTQPVSVGTETHSINRLSSIQGVQVFTFIQIPQHSLPILKFE